MSIIQFEEVLPATTTLPQLINVASSQQPSKICPNCGRQFKKFSKLLIHQQSVHEQKRAFTCQVCQQTFTRKDHLVRHTNSKHVKERDLFDCPKKYEGCLMSFPNKDQLNKHVKRTHNKKPLRCMICLNLRVQNLTTMAHDSESEKSQQNNTGSIQQNQLDELNDFDLQQITFNKKNQLKRHIAIFHNDSLVCTDHCRRQFKSKKSLQAHLYRVRDQAELRASKLYIFNQHSIAGSDLQSDESSQYSCEIITKQPPKLQLNQSHNLPCQLESGSQSNKFDWENSPHDIENQRLYQIPSQIFLKRKSVSQKQTLSPFLQLDSDSSDDIKMCMECGKMQSARESNTSFLRHVQNCSSQRLE